MGGIILTGIKEPSPYRVITIIVVSVKFLYLLFREGKEEHFSRPVRRCSLYRIDYKHFYE